MIMEDQFRVALLNLKLGENYSVDYIDALLPFLGELNLFGQNNKLLIRLIKPSRRLKPEACIVLSALSTVAVATVSTDVTDVTTTD